MAKKEYTYQYEEGKIIRATECDITLDNNQFVVAKTIVNTIKYYYDSEGTMTKKVITAEDGTSQIIYYEQSEDDNTVVKFVAGGKTITSHSKSDSFGRKEFDELQLGTGFVARQFHYHAGEITEEHQENAKLKSSATTQLVSQIVLSNGTTISYAYDAEERITSVVETYTVDDSTVTNTTHYTYDALGQLLTETTNDNPVNTMTYDYYGNIKTKNGVVYDYDAIWKDKLIKVGGKSITYDAQGNPTYYLGHILTWEKGRQLKSFDGNTYTYNANGIRTSKTIDGVRHDFVLDGAKILRECWNFDESAKIYRDILVPLYDNEDSVCGIIYNDEPYYFQKNLQGDIIGIVDKDSTVVAKYSYDAWGKCTVDFTDLERTCGIDIANINPFRYRGYYFDREIGLYYVSSRYYDPEIGRFINADEATYLGADSTVLSYNLYAYCENEPTNNEDHSGNWLLRVICGVAAGAVFGGVALAICTLLKLTKKQKTYISLAFTALGVLLGALLGVKIITKVAPQLIKWFRKIEKNIAFSFKGEECKVGVEFFHTFKIMIHRPHTKGLHKYNPIGWHIQFEIKGLGKWVPVFRIKIDTIVKWYQSMK